MTRDDIAEVVAVYALPPSAPRGDEWSAVVCTEPRLRCACCPAPATEYLLSRLCGPFCAACANEAEDAGELFSPRRDIVRARLRQPHVAAVRMLDDALVYRDRRAELGLPPDPRFYGTDWTLFDAAGVA